MSYYPNLHESHLIQILSLLVKYQHFYNTCIGVMSLTRCCAGVGTIHIGTMQSLLNFYELSSSLIKSSSNILKTPDL